MHFKQYYLGCLSHASYLIGDPVSGQAAVVDPQRDVDQYLADAKAKRLRIKHVILTHFHADFVSGHLELKKRIGATIHLGRRAKADYAFSPLGDGDELRLGTLTLRALETPGHTPEAICVLVFDGKSAPHAVLTGDTLFVGDVGRPDLMASIGISAKVLAGMMYESLHKKLLPLPDETLVYPAHGAGSLCGRSMGPENFSTIGKQRQFNPMLKPMPKARFVKLLTAEQSEAPQYFSYNAQLNRSNRPTLEKALSRSLKALALPRFLHLRGQGAQVLDTRDPAVFDSRHLSGSVNVGLGGKFATWAGTVLEKNAPILLVCEPGREKEAAMRLGRIGFDRVAGYLKGGFAALKKRQDLLRTIDRIDAGALKRELSSRQKPLVLDVRTLGERNMGKIAGSTHVPLSGLLGKLSEVPKGRRLVVHCAGGYRSTIAASLLERAGWKQLADLDGGFAAWGLRESGKRRR